MTSIWYGSEMGFLQSYNWVRESLYAILFLPAIPFLCAVYVFFPNTKVSIFMGLHVTETLPVLSADIYGFKNGVHQYQLASKKTADEELHCFQSRLYI